MCRAVSLARVVATAAILCGRPVEALAQDTRVYEQRVDSLAKVSRQAHAVLLAYEDSLRRNSRRYDSVVVAPLRVLTDSASSSLARTAAHSVVATLTPTYGATLASLADHSFVVRDEPGESRRLIFVGGLGRDGQEYSVAVVEPRADVVTRTLLTAAMQVLRTEADPALMRWLGSAPPIDTASATVWTGTRLALVSSPSVGRRCYAGDLPACRIALGLVQASDPATAWFDSTDRQRLMERIADEQWRNPDPTGMTACVLGSDTACISVLRRFPVLLPGDPLGFPQRVSLVQLAAAVGGPGSTERFLLTPGTPSERIGAAARMPTDSVIRLWLGRARDARLVSNDMSVGIAASSIVWILACAALALRSSRWR